MTTELQNGLLWLATLMAPDIGKVAAGLMVMLALIEVLARVKEWIGK